MKSYKLIHQLLTLAEQLEGERPGEEIGLKDFSGFLLNHLKEPHENSLSPDIRFGKNEPYAQELAYQVDNNIGRLFVYMSRYAKSYIKKALDGTSIQTAEEFTCLAILLTHDHLTKSELINRNLQEKTSGTEVIRRLIATGLAKQWDDDSDKRVKRIAITEKGKQLLYVVFVDMGHVGQIITGTLSLDEKLTLQYLLQKLENFHYQQYELKTVQNKSDLKVIAEQLIEY
jgi:DNA-binding MarR family transcriptional regulator